MRRYRVSRAGVPYINIPPGHSMIVSLPRRIAASVLAFVLFAFYAPFVRDLAAWGSPMDTYKSVDSEGNRFVATATFSSVQINLRTTTNTLHGIDPWRVVSLAP